MALGYTNKTMTDEILSIKNFLVIDDAEREKLMQDVLRSREVHDNAPNSYKVYKNFRVLSDSPFFKMLYDRTFNQCEAIFGKLEITEHNSTDCWSVATNKDYWASVPHDHTKTAIINTVYYLNVPKIDGKYVGTFRYINKQDEWVDYQPEPFELLVMPAYLVHDNGYNDTEEWRISINMEIITRNHVDFKLLDIK
jgi:hypothetical protein